jgi:uncharacterized membrane protein YdjX (TVP38/TMEM64 family)
VASCARGDNDVPIPTALRSGHSEIWYRALHSRGLLGIVAVVAVGALLATWMTSLGGAELMREQLGPVGALFIIPVQAVVAVSPFPSEVMALVTSAFYGFWGGSLLAWCAWFVAAFLQYWLVRRTARDFDFERARRRFPKRLRELPVSHPAFLILGRWLPYGPHVVNSAAGAYGVPLSRHAWCAAVSIIPHALVISGLANGLLAG